MNAPVTSSLYRRAPGREMERVRMATDDSTCYRGVERALSGHPERPTLLLGIASLYLGSQC